MAAVRCADRRATVLSLRRRQPPRRQRGRHV